jgi:hypothetical protein
MTQGLTLLLPTLTAVLGLTAGLLAPVITAATGMRQRRREEQRALCEEILALFKDVHVFEALTSGGGMLRRNLMLLAVRLLDEDARRACYKLVQRATDPECQSTTVLDEWTLMITEVSRVYRACM